MNKLKFQEAVELINKSSSILITTHTKGDGDAAGCCVAMSETLSTLGKKNQIIFLSPLPDWYAFLFDKPAPVLGKDISKDQLSQNNFYLDTSLIPTLPSYRRGLPNSVSTSTTIRQSAIIQQDSLSR